MRDWIRGEDRDPHLYKELAAGVVVSSAVFLAASLIPDLGFVIGMFAPLPVIYYSKSGRMQGLVVFALALLVVISFMAVIGSGFNIAFLIVWGSFGIVLSEMFRKKYAIDKIILLSIVVLTLIALAFLSSYSLRMNEDPWTLIEKYVSGGVNGLIQAYSQAGVSQEQVSLIKNNAGQISKFIYHVFPALMIVSMIFLAWLNVMAAKILFEFRKLPFSDFGDLTSWKIPDKFVWFVIAAGAMILVPIDRFKISGLNMLIVFLFIYLFQGLSIINFFFKKKGVPVLLRGMFYFLIFAQHILALLVICLGFFDIWIDFRKLNRGVKLPVQGREPH